MAANPQGFFRFAANNYPLLQDLFHRREGCTEADLRGLIAATTTDSAPSPTHIIEQLLALGIIEPIPDATATFELTAPVQNLLSYLLREHRLTSAKEIQAHLTDLDELRAELDAASQQNLGPQALRALNDISQLIERIRQGSHSNREAIIGEVIQLKSNRGRRSAKERFEIINRLWTRYLEPMRDLIDVKKAMDASLDDLERCLLVNAKTFAIDGSLSREFSRCRARLLRLRREMTEDFSESIREIEPLYRSLKRESELVRGASLALEKLDRSGVASVQIPELMALPILRFEGLFSDTFLESYLSGIKGYEPGQPQPLVATPEAPPPECILPSALLARLAAALPVDDLLAWLLAEYPEAGVGELVRAYGRIFLRPTSAMQFAGEERCYALPNATLIARPLRLEKV